MAEQQRLIETCFNYCEDDGIAYMSSNERKWINKLRKYASERPSECTILEQPETNHGFIYAKVPQSWLYVRPPVKRELTEEQRLAGAERLRKLRESKQGD